MQIFITGTPLETALDLDKKRFYRQLSEAKIIRKAIMGLNGWKGPLIEMYRNNTEWLDLYILIFEAIRIGDIAMAEYLNKDALKITPIFHSDKYILNMKSRLYTKDNIYYKKWSHIGESYINMYWKGNEWIYIKQTKEA